MPLEITQNHSSKWVRC